MIWISPNSQREGFGMAASSIDVNTCFNVVISRRISPKLRSKLRYSGRFLTKSFRFAFSPLPPTVPRCSIVLGSSTLTHLSEERTKLRVQSKLIKRLLRVEMSKDELSKERADSSSEDLISKHFQSRRMSREVRGTSCESKDVKD